MAQMLMKCGRFQPLQLTTLLFLATSISSDNVLDADFSLIPRIGGAVRTTMSTATEGFNSSLAIDGMAGDPNKCKCCSIADKQTPHAWLEIDLGQQYYVTGIKIYGRNDAPSDAQSKDIGVYIGNNSLATQELSTALFSIQSYDTAFPFTKELQPTQRFQFLLLRKNTSGYLSICEVQLREDTQLTIGRNPRMSASMSVPYLNFYANLAIDGNADTPFDSCHCCSATNGSTIPWWQLNLGNKYLIQRIELVGRRGDNTDQSRNVNIYINNQTLVSGSPPINYNTTLLTSVADFSGHLYSMNVSKVFQFLMIRRWYTSVLTICEVKLYTQVCGFSRYGEGCLHSCHCSENTMSDPATGVCPNGCAPGYTGTTCNTACTDGFYGHNCSNKCGHCSQNSQCDKVDGRCSSGCAPGYVEPICKTACSDGFYGQNCSKKCGHCSQNSQCDMVDGHCSSGCAPGYVEPICETACSNGTYGPGCSRHCHCVNGTACDIHTGTCQVDCDVGWSGPSCQTDDSLLSKLSNATATTSNIWNGFNANLALDGLDDNLYTSFPDCKCCSVVDGHKPWWQVDLGTKYLVGAVYIVGRKTSPSSQSKGIDIFGSNKTEAKNDTNNRLFSVSTTANGTRFLHEFTDHPRILQFLKIQKWNDEILTICEVRLLKGECPSGQFGDRCRRRCHCSDQKTCDPIYGTCQSSFCSPGWTSSACDTECRKGTFGQNCSGVTHCINGTANNNVNGSCQAGVCAPGWREHACDKECENRTFGQNCSSVAHCINSTANNNVNGSCQAGACDPGWRGDACDTACETGHFGQHCSGIAHCIIGTANNNVNGSCHAGVCEPGWMGEACDTACKNGYFGQNCSEKAHCINGTCNNNVNGACLEGACEFGWQDLSCDKECARGRFGQNCSGVAHCINGTANNNINGSCLTGACDPGWTGEACDTEVELQTGDDGRSSTALPAVGGGLGAAAIVAVVVVVVFIKKRQLSKQSSDTDARFDVSNIQPVRPKHSPSRWKETNADGFDDDAIGEDVHAYYSFSTMKSAIKSSQLWHYIRKMQADKSKAFFDEFETLPDGLKLPCKEALRPENRPKNRYRDKYAYDHSRVVLKITGPGQTDYINASHIHGFERSQKFIASQGPTDKMLDDFWRMIWQQQSTTIVMLTNCMENGNKKCEKYWPDDDEVGAYGAVRVKVIATDMYADYYRREMEVSMADSPSRIVTQFHFKSWPDKDVPDSTWCLVNFWRAASRHPAPSDKAPIIVHCSAGIGRTGTYIALDYLYNQLQHEGSVQPLKAVQALRQQRVNMVQTRHQYAYLHEAVADAMGLGTHFIWASQFEDYFNYLTMVQPGSSKSPLEIQFDLAVRSIQDLQAEKAVGTGEDDVGLYANASIAAEIDAYRPATKKRGSKYVQEMGAMYLPGYTGAGVFLVANSPTEKSLVEFWSLVREENIKTVISLCESTAKNYKAASQLGVDSGLLKGTFDINALDLNRCSSYNERTYMFWENGQTEEESRVTVRVFDYTAWKAGYNTPVEAGSLLELLEAVTSWQPHVSESQPILIHCNTGTRRSGVVCLLLSELQRIKREDGQVNLLDSLMVLMERCHGVIENAGQYQFCHDVIRRHLDQQQRHQQQDPGDQNIYANL